jgi:hypothetical protein
MEEIDLDRTSRRNDRTTLIRQKVVDLLVRFASWYDSLLIDLYAETGQRVTEVLSSSLMDHGIDIANAVMMYWTGYPFYAAH